MHSAICRTEYSCGHRAGCPPLRPERCVSPCPHYSDALTKSNKAKNKEERAKSVPGKKSTPKLHDAVKTERKEGKELKRFWAGDTGE